MGDDKPTLFDSNGDYFQLEIAESSKDIPAGEFVPRHPTYPDACRYVIRSVATNEWLIIENLAKADDRVKALKRVHGIVDPWDGQTDYFKNVQVQDQQALFDTLSEEQKKEVSKILDKGRDQ